MVAPQNKFIAYKNLVNAHLENFLDRYANLASAALPRSLYEPVRYAIEGNGKRIRPVLVLLACDAFGAEPKIALPAAAAVELMHNFTLVHDDIMDRDDTRRGRPTVHRKWDTDTAILAGDALVVLAYQSLLETDSPHLNRLSRIFTEGVLKICEGQALDREFEQDHHVTPARYEDMISKKTAWLLTMCAQIGAILGEATAAQVESLRRYAEHVGLAFQIQDDLLDITIAQEVLGKDFGSDVKRRKRTFLYVHAMQHGGERERAALRAIYKKPEILPEDILSAQRIFQATHTLPAAEQAVREHLRQAEILLNELGKRVRSAELRNLVEMILHRNA
ncbi:MAG: polyprenyl synthetase family protein [candidate division KSB1 bacterium]